MRTAPASFHGPRIAFIGFLVLTAAFGLNFAAGQFFAPLGREEGWGVAELSAAAALNTGVAGLVQPLAGRLIDRVGARAVISAAIALLAGAYLLLAFVQELWQFYVVYGVLAGVGFGGASSMAVSVLISHWYTRRRATVLARTFMGINAGQLTLLPLGGVLIATSGPRTGYLVLGLVVMVVVVPAAVLGLRSSPADVGQHPDGDPGRAPATSGVQATFGEAMRSRDWWLLTAAFGMNGATLYLMLLHLPRLAVDVGGGLAAGGGLIAAAAATSALSMLVHGALAARFDKRWLIVWLFVLRGASLALAATATSVGQLYVVAALFGAASFPVIPLVTGAIGERFGTRAIGAVLGTTFVVHQLGAGIGVLAAGLVRDATGSYDAALLAAAAALLVGAALVTRVNAQPTALDAPFAFSPSPTTTLQGGTP